MKGIDLVCLSIIWSNDVDFVDPIICLHDSPFPQSSISLEKTSNYHGGDYVAGSSLFLHSLQWNECSFGSLLPTGEG